MIATRHVLYPSDSPTRAVATIARPLTLRAVRATWGEAATHVRDPRSTRRARRGFVTPGGDVNADGSEDIADPVRLLLFLFAGADAPSCAKSADVNDSGAIDVSDAIYELDFLFTGGEVPPAPAGVCGEDATDDALDCLVSPCE